MRDFMLIVHFIGLAMGLGTSVAFMFLGIASSKMDKTEGQKFILNSFALSRMGHIGLTLLVLSGIYLMMPYWGLLFTMPLLQAKLGLVLILGALIGINSSRAKKAKLGNAEEQLKKMAMTGRITLVTSLAIVILAVLVFH